MTDGYNGAKRDFKSAFARVIAVIVLLIAFALAYAAAEFPHGFSVVQGGGTSYICIEAESGKVIDECAADERRFPASTTKILTALVVLENLPLGVEFRVPDCAVGVEGSSVYLKRGEVVNTEDMLYGLMMRSGNDAAVALAVATAGSVEKFAAMMNDRARKAGAVNSNFVNPHGLHDDNHYTTARDLALIAAEAYRNADFRRIVATSKITVGEGGNTRVFYNKNKLLSMLDGANGVKTGYTTRSGKCLVGGAVTEGVQRISVVLGATCDMWQLSKKLLTQPAD